MYPAGWGHSAPERLRVRPPTLPETLREEGSCFNTPRGMDGDSPAGRPRRQQGGAGHRRCADPQLSTRCDGLIGDDGSLRQSWVRERAGVERSGGEGEGRPLSRISRTIHILLAILNEDCQVSSSSAIPDLLRRLDPPEAADVRFGVVVDHPGCSETVGSGLLALQGSAQWIGRMRLRFNAANLGAPGAR